MAGAAQPTAEVAARSQSSDYEQKLAAARSYFWRRDIGAAMQAYESLTTAYPNSAEAWGELGNVSFKLGHWSQAAEAYYHAVSLLIEGGETERAQHLLRVLHGLDADKAGELERRMRKPGG
jgi:tetratricopeptide (TPR) repeat protein